MQTIARRVVRISAEIVGRDAAAKFKTVVDDFAHATVEDSKVLEVERWLLRLCITMVIWLLIMSSG